MIVALFLYILLPAGLVSVGLACIPWRPLRLRVVLLVAQIVASIVLIVRLPGVWELWAWTLGPGALVAAWRAASAGVAITWPEPGTPESGEPQRRSR